MRNNLPCQSTKLKEDKLREARVVNSLGLEAIALELKG